MLNNFYTLRALVQEWKSDLEDTVLQDAFSQVAGELTLAFAGDERDWMLRTSVERPMLFIFRTEGISKKKRNVATLFEAAHGRRVTRLHIAKRDRMIFIDLAGGFRFQFTLFGTRANVFLVAENGTVREAFRASDKHAGEPAPSPRTAPEPDTFDAFEERWTTDRSRIDKALRAVYPIFDRTLGEEVMHRAGVKPAAPSACTEADRRALFKAARSLIEDLRHPSPRIYGGDEQFALVPLHDAPDGEERFETVDEAVRVFTRRRLAAQHFERLYAPLEEALSEAVQHHRQSAERIQEELAGPDRADRYEQFGHLLKALPQEVPARAEEATLPNLFGEGEQVTIPMDPARSAVENAERYYEKARRARRAREEAEARLETANAQAAEAERLLHALRDIDRLSELKKFRKCEEEALAPFVGQKDEEVQQIPFRRFQVADGYEVWVGRNARQNDELTFHHAQKYDLWMHARGVPGSHTVLRLPNRDDDPPKRVVHQAAQIAAYFSKARGHGAAPVMVTRRKYVTSPSGAPPGTVRVEHEDVIFVEPSLPSQKPEN